ncbi:MULTISPECIES: hypothetical protein [unclassified Brevibacterium]|uniref:hypothetical protein n=1 Tax=unclassified Brevibacterium TaxID=2614124 RepID=UPI0010F9376D|nr:MULTISPECIES: hypothetical protein [unclassified Brevibacterium]MCM1013050.1 hypothetical protein [Brevibacterium sp. XM4083]
MTATKAVVRLPSHIEEPDCVTSTPLRSDSETLDVQAVLGIEMNVGGEQFGHRRVVDLHFRETAE